MVRLQILLAVCLLTSSVGAQQISPETEAQARALEERLRAPCCWNQTIDIHSSPLAQDMRHEVRVRLSAGETPDAIAASYVERYGDRILAVPEGNPLGAFALGVILFALLAGGGVVVVGIRWRRRSARDQAEAAAKPAVVGGEPDEWDARLDAELGER